jgi:RNA polymerase sigma factor (sigma-70 family)
MADLATSMVGLQIESLFEGGSVTGLTDRQLLERFTALRDAGAEVAFTALVTRHGPMVLGICRQILHDCHLAEDAFQAVFLVLASKARSIRNPDLLGMWLYGVALRTAQKANARLIRQRKNEGAHAMSDFGADSEVEPMSQPADVSAMAREQAEILHDEIARLPQSFRLPIILCYFEGLTLAEASHRLQWPAGTLHSRLARARDKLRRRIVRRGLIAPAAALAVGLSNRSASAFVSPALSDSTARAAIRFAAGQAVSSWAASLARDVLRAMFANKLRLIAKTVLLVTACATGAGCFAFSLASQHEPKRQPDAHRPQVAARSDDTNQRPAPGRMFVAGRVLDPEGKPVPNAETMVYAAIKQPGRVDGYAEMTPSAIGQARSDGSGLFQIDAPRTISSRHHQTGMVALAPGYGAGWVELDPDADRPNIDITLRPEQVIRERFFDVNGRPAQGVTVMVQTMGRLVPADLPNHRKESIDGPAFWWNTVKSLPAWPVPSLSDVDGKFAIRGAGRDLRVILAVDDPRFARQQVSIDTDGAPESKPLKIALEPAKIIKGRITDAGTGKPIPHAPVRIASLTHGASNINEFQADAEGRFRANPLSADRYGVSASAPEGRPYLSVEKYFNWPKGAVEHSMDFALPQGVVIHGKVTEEGSGRPVAGARIRLARRLFDKSGASNGQTASDANGSYRLAALTGPGYLTVLGPSDDYVLRDESGDSVLPQGASAGGRRFYAHAFIACDPKMSDQSVEINVALRRGVTVIGQVVGPEGQPVHDAWMISRFFLHPSYGAWLVWSARDHGSVASGRFTIHGLDPNAEAPVYFLDPLHRLGATVNISGKSASRAPVIVQLAPCGAAKARLVDATGKPIVGYRASSLITMVVNPAVLGAGDRATINGIDAINYANGPVSDDQGRVIFPALIPGAYYRRTPRTPNEAQPTTDFSVKPGETIDLGDIVIQKPRAGN